MGTLSGGIWLISISILAKGGKGRRRRKVRRCENCGQVMVRTSNSSYRCQNCNPDRGERIAKAVGSLIGRVRPASPGGGDLTGPHALSCHP
jgi:hypothetical protein